MYPPLFSSFIALSLWNRIFCFSVLERFMFVQHKTLLPSIFLQIFLRKYTEWKAGFYVDLCMFFNLYVKKENWKQKLIVCFTNFAELFVCCFFFHLKIWCQNTKIYFYILSTNLFVSIIFLFSSFDSLCLDIFSIPCYLRPQADIGHICRLVADVETPEN